MPEANDPWASLADSLGAVPAPDQASPQPSPAQPTPPRPRADLTRRPEAKKPAPPAGGGDWTDIVSGLGLQPDPQPPRPVQPPRQPAPPAARERDPVSESFDREPESRPARERRADDDRPADDLPPRARSGEPPADAFGFQDRPIVDRGGSDRASSGRRDDDGRRDGGRSGGRGGRGDGRRGSTGERRPDDRPPAARHDQPRPQAPRAPGRDDAPVAHERAGGESDEAGDDLAPGDDRVREGGDGVEGERSGEPRRGRRRRGRRGGRGRGGRDRDEAPRGEGAPERTEGEAPQTDDRDDEFGFEPRRPAEEAPRQERRPPAPPRRQDDGERRPARGHDAEGPIHPSRDERPAAGFDWDAPVDRAPPGARSQGPDRAPPRRPEREEDDGWGGIDLEPREPAGDVSEGGERGQGDGEPRGDSGDESSGRRRRRRGRRGGRRRGGRERTGDERAASDAVPGDSAAPSRSDDDTADDEPLPSGYGRAPAPPRPAASGSRGSEGEPRGRRRRGRGDRKGSSPRAGSAANGEPGAEGGDAKTRSRSGRRGTGARSRRPEPELRSTSRLSRGRRDDFAPVAGGYDEDDEGLDFLGIEEAGREPAARTESRRSDDDELLAESGLASVTDVPSWVEAIGIVIAGNLDARNRPPRGGDDHDRGRRDGSRGRN